MRVWRTVRGALDTVCSRERPMVELKDDPTARNALKNPGGCGGAYAHRLREIR